MGHSIATNYSFNTASKDALQCGSHAGEHDDNDTAPAVILASTNELVSPSATEHIIIDTNFTLCSHTNNQFSNLTTKAGLVSTEHVELCLESNPAVHPAW